MLNLVNIPIKMLEDVLQDTIAETLFNLYSKCIYKNASDEVKKQKQKNRIKVNSRAETDNI